MKVSRQASVGPWIQGSGCACPTAACHDGERQPRSVDLGSHLWLTEDPWGSSLPLGSRAPLQGRVEMGFEGEGVEELTPSASLPRVTLQGVRGDLSGREGGKRE